MHDSAPTTSEDLDQIQKRSNLTRRQLLIWLGQQRHGDVPIYSSPFLWRFEQALDCMVLRTAFQNVVDAHDILRTVITIEAGVPQAHVVPDVKVDLEIVDFSRRADGDAAMREHVARCVAQPFQLGERLFASTLINLPRGCAWLLNEHHLITDGRSKQLVFEKTAAAYARLSGHVLPEESAAVPYSEFVEFERRSFEKRSAQRSREYWTAFARSSPAGEIFPRSAGGDSSGVRLSRTLDAATARRIRASGGEGNGNLVLVATLMTVLLAALHERTGRTALTIGHTLSNRPTPRLQSIPGLCLEIAPLAATFEHDELFSTLRLKVMKQIMEGMRHLQYVPWNRPGRPAFDVMFNYLNPRFESFCGVQARTEWIYPGHQENSLDLQIQEFRDDDGLEIAFDFRRDAMLDAERETLTTRFFAILEKALNDTNARLDRLTQSAGSARGHEFESWSLGPVAAETCADLATRFEEQVERTPDACAAVHARTRWTYRQLNDRANSIAHALLHRGVGSESPVAISLPRSLDMVTAILGVLKAGGTYVPLNPGDPLARLRDMIHDAGVTHLISDADFAARSAPLAAVSVFILDDWHADGSESRNPSVSRTRDSLAYILFTSGSTGRPKGVAIPHRGPLTLIDWAVATFGRQNLAGMLFSTSICFDLSVFEIFVPLSVGGKLVLVRDALALPACEAAAEVTFLNTVPSVMKELIRGNVIPAGVRVIGLAGETLSASLVNACYALPGVSAVYNLYGPTEDTVYSTCFLVPRGIEGAVPIGRPVAGTRVFLLNDNLQPVPPGTIGEIHLAGDGLARGYRNHPELTARAFIANPFSTAPGERMYRTGDLGRWNKDGMLEFLGRRDQQVKIRGFRIELAEIEFAIAARPGVQSVAVITHEPAHGGVSLVAFVSPAAVDIESLRRELGTKLPAHMIPARFVTLDALPLNANGKIDRRALKIPAGIATGAAADEEPASENEQRLAEIWRDLLRIPRISRADNFFELGGDSILAMRMVAEVERRTGARLSFVSVFKHPTFGALCTALGGDESAPSGVVALQPRGSKPPLFLLPVTDGDVRVWEPLVKYFDADQPVLGCRFSTANGAWKRFDRFEDFAADLVACIRAFQPVGPYALVGYSFGGRLAYEMGRQLHELGQNVSLLGIVDSEPAKPGPFHRHRERPLAADLISMSHVAAWWFLDFLRLPPRKIATRLGRKIRFAFHRKQQSQHDSDREVQPDRPWDWDNDPVTDTLDAIKHHYRLWIRYKPLPYPGEVTVFRALDRLLSRASGPHLGWREFAKGGVRVFETPGDHASLVTEPCCEALARNISASLRRD